MRGRILLALILVAAALGYLGWVFLGTRVQVPLGPRLAASAAASQPSGEGFDLGVGTDPRHASETLAAAPGIGSLPDSAAGISSRIPALREELRDLLGVYLGGTGSDLHAYMEEHRLSVPEGWSTEPDFEAAWLDSTRLLRTARFNATGVMARPRFIAGTPVDNPDLTVYSAQREARAPGLADPARAGLDVLEVILPAQMQTDDGTAFNGRVGLWFAWDPGAGRWQLTKFCVYDRPAKALRMPLL